MNKERKIEMELMLENPMHFKNFKLKNKTTLPKFSQELSLKYNSYLEEDNSITISLIDFDIAVNSNTIDLAIDDIVSELKETFYEYCDEVDYWCSDKSRVRQKKYLLKLFKDKDDSEIRDILLCQIGKS